MAVFLVQHGNGTGLLQSQRNGPPDLRQHRQEVNGKTMESERCYVGIDAGSVSLNAIAIDADRKILYEAPYRRHFGRVEQETRCLIQDLQERLGREN
ncbi:MAG: hypothetical protein RBT20_15095, partial [Syntrophales bacterium]|nr:hypothetical protein [Syntrophales bacterium]